MKKRLAAVGLSAMIVGMVVLPASPASADHCYPTRPDEQVACAWDHIADCVSELIREHRCGDPN